MVREYDLLKMNCYLMSPSLASICDLGRVGVDLYSTCVIVHIWALDAAWELGNAWADRTCRPNLDVILLMQRKFSLDLKRAQSCAYIYAGIILSFLSDYAEIQASNQLYVEILYYVSFINI